MNVMDVHDLCDTMNSKALYVKELYRDGMGAYSKDKLHIIDTLPADARSKSILSSHEDTAQQSPLASLVERDAEALA